MVFGPVQVLAASHLRHPDVPVSRLVRLVGESLAIRRPRGVILDTDRRRHLNRVREPRKRRWPARQAQKGIDGEGEKGEPEEGPPESTPSSRGRRNAGDPGAAFRVPLYSPHLGEKVSA